MEDQYESSSSGNALTQPMGKSSKTVVGIITVLVVLAACVHAYAWWNEIWWATGEFKPGPAITVEYSDVTFGQNMAGTVVQGSVTNNTQTTYRDVQVEVELLDGSGSVIGTATKTTDSLVPGQVWEYQALMNFDKAISGRVKEVTGYY